MSVKDKAAAIDRFVRTIKESGAYDDIGTACIMAGWTNLAGALTPLKGAAPTNNGFLAADLDAGIGLKGDGSTKNLATGRANNADPQDSKHLSVYAAKKADTDARFYIGSAGINYSGLQGSGSGAPSVVGTNNSTTFATARAFAIGLLAVNRQSSSQFTFRIGGVDHLTSATSATPPANELFVFDRLNASLASNATLSWYSIGSATDLAALDSAVSTLMADLRAIDEAGFDRDALAYIRNVEAADGAYLETGVKQAINAFVVGCKKDGIWDAIKASCILCGARTISGALVPLAGTAPTPYNFASGDYSRTTGLKGDGATKYLDSNRSLTAETQDDAHIAIYASTPPTSGAAMYSLGAGGNQSGASAIFISAGYWRWRLQSNADSTNTGIAADTNAGFVGASRNTSGSFLQRCAGTEVVSGSRPSQAASAYNYHVFNDSYYGAYSNARLAFYSIGSALDLAALDTRVSTLVAAIAAAL